MRVASLGAGTGRVARQMLTERLPLAALSGGVALLLAVWGLGAIRYFGADQLPRLDKARIDARVLALTFGVSVLFRRPQPARRAGNVQQSPANISAAAGYLPARRASGVDPLVALRCE